MEVNQKGGRAFSYLEFNLQPGESIVTEPGAMASMQNGINLRVKLNGSIFRALALRLFGKESVFINSLKNESGVPSSVVITQPTPGEIQVVTLDGNSLYMQPGAFIACTPGITFSLRWAGFTSWMMGEGLLRLRIEGRGTCWYGSYGAVVEKVIKGSYVVDNGHLLSYPPDMKLKLQLSGGIFSSLFGGEGFVVRMEGNGTIKLQTRSLSGLANWLNPKF